MKGYSGVRLLLPTLLLLQGCGTDVAAPESQVLSGDVGYVQPELGAAYNEYTDDFIGDPCVDLSALSAADYEIIPPKAGDLKLEQSMDSKTARSFVKGKADAKLDMASFDVKGDLEIEKEVTSDNLSATMTLAINASNGKHRIKNDAITAGKVKLTPMAKRLVDTNASKSEKTAKCGSGFLKEYDLSASFFAVLRFEFRSEADTNKFKGKLNLAMQQFQVNGELNTDVKEASKHGKTSLVVIQRGGNATQIGATISENMVKCNEAKPDACLAAFEAIRVYAKDTWPKQFEGLDAGSINPRAFWFSNAEFASYNSVTESWDGMKPTEEIKKALTQHRITMNDAFLQELRDKSRVRTIIQSGMVTDIPYRNKLVTMQGTFDDRMLALAKAIEPCYKIDDNYLPCEQAAKSYKEKLAQFPVDYSLLTIHPENFMQFCTQMEMWHTTYFGVGTPGSGDYQAPNPNAAEIDMVEPVRNTITEILNLGPVKLVQDQRQFTPYVNKATQGFYYPRDPTAKASGIAYWNCAFLSSRIGNIEEEIKLSNLNLSNIDPVVSLRTAKILDLSVNKVEYGIQALGKMRYLETLKLNDAHVATLKGIVGPKLRYLYLQNNDIGDDELQYLANAHRLEVVDLSGNVDVTSLAGLANMRSLKTLNVKGTSLLKDDMESFLTTGYPALKSTPTIVWNGPACIQVKQAQVANSDKLECE